jgi:hypothetical protein
VIAAVCYTYAAPIWLKCREEPDAKRAKKAMGGIAVLVQEDNRGPPLFAEKQATFGSPPSPWSFR